MCEFTETLFRPDGTGTWTYVKAGFDVEAEFGVKTRVPVRGTVDGAPFASSLLPQGNGEFILVVGRELREQIGKSAGDTVTVQLEKDTAPRTVEPPVDLEEALGNNPEAKRMFSSMSYSHQKEYVRWIESAKKPETRASRIEGTIERVLREQPLK